MDGIVFASIAESKRYCELRLLERAGEIRDLRQGRSFELCVNGVVVEEVKSGTSSKEKDYRLRRRVFEASTGLQVTEVLVK